MITVHDDMAATASNTQTLHEMVQDLQWIINIVDMGPIKWFLGIATTWNCLGCTIPISQTVYIKTILKWFHMDDSYIVSMPLDPNITLSRSMSLQLDGEWQKMKTILYLAGVGSLMYASMVTWLDITYATNKLSQFTADLGLAHWTALQWVFHCLKKMKDYVLTLGGPIESTLIDYTDLTMLDI